VKKVGGLFSGKTSKKKGKEKGVQVLSIGKKELQPGREERRGLWIDSDRKTKKPYRKRRGSVRRFCHPMGQKKPRRNRSNRLQAGSPAGDKGQGGIEVRGSKS